MQGNGGGKDLAYNYLLFWGVVVLYVLQPLESALHSWWDLMKSSMAPTSILGQAPRVTPDHGKFFDLRVVSNNEETL